MLFQVFLPYVIINFREYYKRYRTIVSNKLIMIVWSEFPDGNSFPESDKPEQTFKRI